MQLVDEGDDLTAGRADLLKHGFEPLLELTAVFRTSHHRRQVETDQPLVLQRLRDVVVDDPLGQTLDHRCLADTGITDQDGVVLGTPGQDLHDAPDFGVASDHRVELALACGCGHVRAVFVQRVVSGFGVSAGDLRAAAQRGDLTGDGLAVDPKLTGAG